MANQLFRKKSIPNILREAETGLGDGHGHSMGLKKVLGVRDRGTSPPPLTAISPFLPSAMLIRQLVTWLSVASMAIGVNLAHRSSPPDEYCASIPRLIIPGTSLKNVSLPSVTGR